MPPTAVKCSQITSGQYCSTYVFNNICKYDGTCKCADGVTPDGDQCPIPANSILKQCKMHSGETYCTPTVGCIYKNGQCIDDDGTGGGSGGNNNSGGDTNGGSGGDSSDSSGDGTGGSSGGDSNNSSTGGGDNNNNGNNTGDSDSGNGGNSTSDGSGNSSTSPLLILLVMTLIASTIACTAICLMTLRRKVAVRGHTKLNTGNLI